MAEQQQTRIAAPFPAPPPFYKHFTKQNTAQLRRLQKAAPPTSPTTSNEPPTRNLDILTLPPELRYLLPPPPPQTATFSAFGTPHTHPPTTPTLPSLSIPQLFPAHASVLLNPQTHLIALARSQLTTFLALVGALSQDAEAHGPYVLDLEHLAFNMAELVNAYRVHQARETLVGMMEARVEGVRGEVGRVGEGRERLVTLLGGLKGGGGGGGGGSKEGGEGDGGSAEERVEEGRRARQRRAWAALEGLGESGESRG
ncbi:hypothetical protein LTR08_002912 [Meristemomyces frigidus]|nr:hypothetical protein LTR08_002912 [Meristemomyces frigidus]